MLVIVTYDVSTETPEGRPSSTFARSASPGQPAGRGLKRPAQGGQRQHTAAMQQAHH